MSLSRLLRSSRLSRQLTPDVQNKHRGNEQQAEYKHGQRLHLDPGRVLVVVLPALSLVSRCLGDRAWASSTAMVGSEREITARTIKAKDKEEYVIKCSCGIMYIPLLELSCGGGW